MNKRPIYGYCAAGSKWRTVHYDEWLDSIAYKKLPRDIYKNPYNGEEKEVTYITMGKKYKIFRKTGVGSNTTCNFSVKLQYGAVGNVSGELPDYIVSGDLITGPDNVQMYLAEYTFPQITTMGRSMASVFFQIYDVYATNDFGAINYLSITYNSNNKDNSIRLSDGWGYIHGSSMKIYVEGDADVYEVDETASVKFESENLYIKYAYSSTPTQMSDVYVDQPYMGTYFGITESFDVKDYTWMKIRESYKTLNVGDNLRGRTIVFNVNEPYPINIGMMILTSDGKLNQIGEKWGNDLGIWDNNNETQTPVVKIYENGEWLINSYTFPNDRDIIITNIVNESYWEEWVEYDRAYIDEDIETIKNKVDNLEVKIETTVDKNDVITNSEILEILNS